MPKFGLIGKKLGHSFSKKYFSEKFLKLGLTNHSYELFELSKISEVPSMLRSHPDMKGFNVTIPYKQEIISYLDHLEEAASAVGAVNTVKISDNQLMGFNTDVYGFEKALFQTVTKENITEALILGSGGASKAVKYVLNTNSIPFQVVSRKGKKGSITYKEVDQECLSSANLIINTTPLGMHPDVLSKPEIPYQFISKNHIFIDLVYNPELTAFLLEGQKRGATIKNGLDMLYYQADKAWDIWNTQDL